MTENKKSTSQSNTPKRRTTPFWTVTMKRKIAEKATRTLINVAAIAVIAGSAYVLIDKVASSIYQAKTNNPAYMSTQKPGYNHIIGNNIMAQDDDVNIYIDGNYDGTAGSGINIDSHKFYYQYNSKDVSGLNNKNPLPGQTSKQESSRLDKILNDTIN